MSKQYYGVIKLAPHIPAWYDFKNEIYLTCGKRWFKCVTDDMDLKPILKGLKAGLIVWDSVENIGTGPADDAKMPVVTFQCKCQVEEEGFGIIEEGVLAPYEPEYDIIPKPTDNSPEEDPEDPPVDPEPEEPPVDPEPEEPEEPENKKLEIKIKQDDVEVKEVIINRGQVELNLVLEVIAEGCVAPMENFKFDVVNNADVLEQCKGEDVVDQPIGENGEIMVKGLAQPKDFNECQVAVIRVHGKCNCEEPHEVEAEVIVKVEKAKMFFNECPIVDVYNPDELEVQGLDFILADMTKEIGPVERRSLDGDENAGEFMGNYVLFAPKDAGLKLNAWDALGGDFAIENPGVIVVNGIEYDVQYLDLLTGKYGIEIEVAQA